MQKSVLDGWIDTLTEREFDAPFLLLLRSHGFFDIHFTHGAYEFGKDFIAKRTENGVVQQYGIQSKAGDIAGSDWDKIRGQLDELVGSWLVHPNYDANAPRQQRLLLTGELRGKAILSSKELAERIRQRKEGNFEVWDRQSLLDFLAGQDPRYPIANPPLEVERIVGRVLADDVPMSWLLRQLEGVGSDVSSLADLRTTLLHLSIVVTAFQRCGRDFHAVRCAQHGVRLALKHWLTSADSTAGDEYLCWLRFALKLGVTRARSNAAMEAVQLAEEAAPPFGAWVAYPHACIQTCESFGLAIVLAFDEEKPDEATGLSAELANFIADNPGCAHPTTDRHAPAVMLTAAALVVTDRRSEAESYIRDVTKWVCDAIEGGLGLAGPTDDERSEVRRLLGSHFDFMSIEVRKESLLAVALCDVSYVLLPELYPDVVNDIKAVGAIPSGLFPEDRAEAMFNTGDGVRSMVNIDYPDSVSANLLPHHALQKDQRELEARGGLAAPMVAACLCGNRLFSDVLGRLTGPSEAKTKE